MRRLHLVVGVAGVVAFLLQGQYMDRWLGHLEGMDHLPRMLYRSGHIYLLFSALLNVVLGLYGSDGHTSSRSATVGSALILIAPILLLLGFFTEAARTDLERPFSRLAIYASFAGVILHALATRARGRSRAVTNRDV
jgi:hypothetical protein